MINRTPGQRQRWGLLDSCPAPQPPPPALLKLGADGNQLLQTPLHEQTLPLPVHAPREPQTTVMSPPPVTSQQDTVETDCGLQSPNPTGNISAGGRSCPNPGDSESGGMAVHRYHRDKDFFKERALPTQGFPLPTGSQAEGPVMPMAQTFNPEVPEH